MSKWVFDLEADGFKLEATQVHCGVFINVDTQEIRKFRPNQIEQMLQFMDTCTVLIGHNVIDYDFGLLNRLHGYKFKGRVVDTVILSRMLYPSIQVPEKMKTDYKEAGKKLDGAHSIAAWGYRLKRGKVEHEDWSTFTEDMMHRCTEDVHINVLVYKEMQKKIREIKNPNCMYWDTFSFFEIVERQTRSGWMLDTERCTRYVNQLGRWLRMIDTVLDNHLPFVPLIKEDKVDDEGRTEGVQRPFTLAGTINKNLDSWINRNDLGDDFRNSISGAFCRVSIRRVNPASDKEIKEFLLAEGWEPDEWNFSKTKTDENGRPIRTSPKLSDKDSFNGIDGKVPLLLCKRVKAAHRKSNLEGYLRRERPDGRMEARISGLADTFRAKHAGIVNVPNTESFFGRQMRAVFTCPEDRVLVSADASGCQDRMLISRARKAGIVDKKFENMLLNGDKKKQTDSHSQAMLAVNAVLEPEGYKTITRGKAKNFNFAYKFNAMDKKLGSMAGGSQQLGGLIRDALDGVFTAQAELQKLLVAEWKETATMKVQNYQYNGKWLKKNVWKNGTIRGLDGRKVRVLNEKDVLVYALQSDEAIMMQKAYILADAEIQKRFTYGVDFCWVCHYHDEFTGEFRPEIAEECKRIMEESITKAGEFYELAIPQIGEGEIGMTWAEVH